MQDALNLARGMSYKNALAGLDLGGGKAVIIGDPATVKTEALLRAYGRFVQSLGGRYVTACDVGTYVADMDVVARECDYVTGRSPEYGGAGDSSVLTAFGVFQAMRACAQQRWGAPTLARAPGRRRRRRQGRPLPGRPPAGGRCNGRGHRREPGRAGPDQDRPPGHRGGGRHRGADPGRPRRLRPLRARRRPGRRHRGSADRLRGLRGGQQPAGPPRRREGPRRPRGALRPGLPGERRRSDPGRATRSRASSSSGPRPRPRRSSTPPWRSSPGPRPTACPRLWPPTGWPRSGWPTSVGSARSCSRATVGADPTDAAARPTRPVGRAVGRAAVPDRNAVLT